MEFEALSSLLDDWYVRGDEGSARRFVQHYLQPLVLTLGRRGLSSADLEDFGQRTMVQFLDRDQRVGARARSKSFWRRWVRWRVLDALRTRGALPEQPAPSEELESESAKTSATSEWQDRMVALLAADQVLNEWLPTHLVTLPIRRRVYLLTSMYGDLGRYLTDEDFEFMKAESGLDRGPAEAALEAGEHGCLTVVFGEARAAESPGKCAESLRRGRLRAIKDLLAGLEAREVQL